MNQIDNITDQASQETQVVLDDGSVAILDLYFDGATQHWRMDITHPLLEVQGINICNFPNILRPWRNLINFGIACITTSGQDPVNVDDFTNGNAALFTLNAADVLAAETTIFGGALQ